MKDQKWTKLGAIAAASLVSCLLVSNSASAQPTLESMKKSTNEAADSHADNAKMEAEGQENAMVGEGKKGALQKAANEEKRAEKKAAKGKKKAKGQKNVMADKVNKGKKGALQKATREEKRAEKKAAKEKKKAEKGTAKAKEQAEEAIDSVSDADG